MDTSFMNGLCSDPAHDMEHKWHYVMSYLEDYVPVVTYLEDDDTWREEREAARRSKIMQFIADRYLTSELHAAIHLSTRPMKQAIQLIKHVDKGSYKRINDYARKALSKNFRDEYQKLKLRHLNKFIEEIPTKLTIDKEYMLATSDKVWANIHNDLPNDPSFDEEDSWMLQITCQNICSGITFNNNV